MDDVAVRATDLDALHARHATALAGLLVDPYAVHFLPPASRRAPPVAAPLIQLGTHARTWTVDRLVRQFLRREGGGQILSLGAGTDTRFWRLKDEFVAKGETWGDRCRRWVEVDFPEATAAKIRRVWTQPVLKGPLGTDAMLHEGGTTLVSPSLCIIPGDLRDPLLLPSLVTAGYLNPSIPTLLLAECVFIYLPPLVVSSSLEWFATQFDKAGGASVSYDPFNFQDSFGQIMLRNLAARDLVLLSAPSVPTLESVTSRLTHAGFSDAHSQTLESIRALVLPTEERERVGRLARIDEVEELQLVLSHYAITWGTLGAVPDPPFGLQHVQ